MAMSPDTVSSRGPTASFTIFLQSFDLEKLIFASELTCPQKKYKIEPMDERGLIRRQKFWNISLENNLPLGEKSQYLKMQTFVLIFFLQTSLFLKIIKRSKNGIVKYLFPLRSQSLVFLAFGGFLCISEYALFSQSNYH